MMMTLLRLVLKYLYYLLSAGGFAGLGSHPKSGLLKETNNSPCILSGSLIN